MKPISFLKISTSLVAFAAMVAASTLQAATANEPFVKGKATIVEATDATAVIGGKSQKLSKGDVLSEGDTIATGPTGKVKASLGESEVNVIESTQVVLEKLEFKKVKGETVVNTTLNLKQGGLIGNVKKISKASNYEVKHAQGVAGIRGTTWAILPGKGVICSEGTVQVSFVVNGVALPPITLGPGQMVLPPAPGQPPVIIDVPLDLAAFIVAFFNERFDGPGPHHGGRDIRVVVSAFSGTSSGSSDEGTAPPPTETPQ